MRAMYIILGALEMKRKTRTERDVYIYFFVNCDKELNSVSVCAFVCEEQC